MNGFPTKEFISLDTHILNNASDEYTALLFATLPGISKVGSYIRNGGVQNIDCGFTTGARFVLIKRTNTVGNWIVVDTVRGITATNDKRLNLNTLDKEVTNDSVVNSYIAGFAVVQNALTNANINGSSYVFLAFA